MQRNLGRDQVANITNSEEWSCLVCDPTQIYEHRARYYFLYRLNKVQGFGHSKITKTSHIQPKRKSDKLSMKAEHIIQSSNNFIEENIGNYL